MSKLQDKECNTQKVVSDKTQESLVLSKETLNSLEELGTILRKVHKRMASEGYKIIDGNIQKM